MAITLVGSGTGTHNVVAGSAYAFTNLRDASNVQPTLLEGDFVVVVTVIAATTNLADGTMTPTTPTGYTGVYTPNLGANDSHDVNMQVSYKFMGSTPDTSVTIRGVPATTNSCSYLVFVFRGVDSASPFDVTSTSFTTNNTGLPNAPSITPSTAGAWILCFGGSAMATGTAPSTTPPTGMDTTTNHFRVASLFTQTNDSAVAGGIKSNWASGPYDPAAFGGFNTTNTGSAAAASLALRPGVAPVWTSSAAPSVAENAVLAHTLAATGADSYSLVGGADQARFEISGTTLRWLSNGTKNFEAPDDADTNNTYVVNVRATNAFGTTDQTITVTVTNVTERRQAARSSSWLR